MILEPVLTYQDEREITALMSRLRALEPKRILEIGSAYGGTLYLWMRVLPPGSLIVSVDLGRAEMADHELWKKWANDCSIRLELVVGDSQSEETRDRVLDICPTFDFVFIDADHSYRGVKRDWELYRCFCRPGGLIVFDDIKPNDESAEPCEVDRLWAEIKATWAQTEELIGDMDHMGNGLGLVYA